MRERRLSDVEPLVRSLVFTTDDALKEATKAAFPGFHVSSDLTEARALLGSSPVLGTVACAVDRDRAAALALQVDADDRWCRARVLFFARPGFRVSFELPGELRTAASAAEAVRLVGSAHQAGLRRVERGLRLASRVSEVYSLSGRQAELVRLTSLGVREPHLAGAMGQSYAAHRKLRSRVYAQCGVQSGSALLRILLSYTMDMNAA